MKQRERYNVAVIGVGAVGEEMLRVLRQRRFPIAQLKVFARSAREITVDGQPYQVEAIRSGVFQGIDIALFAGTEGEKGAAVTYAKEAIAAGAVVIDNGSDFRMDPQVPLVVPEINADDLKQHKGLIANPNCSTIQMVLALAPIHRAATVTRVVVATYQAASGAGRKAVDELREQAKAILADSTPPEASALPRQIAFNVIPQISQFEELGYSTEEWQMVRETHKILHDPSIKITATCVRVPVVTGHAEAVYLETAKHLTVEEVQKLLSGKPGISLVDEYSIPIEVAGKDEVFIGRIRRDPFIDNGLSLWVVSDNLRKGAALNAVQIAEAIIKMQ